MPQPLPIRILGDPVLRQRCEPVRFPDPSLTPELEALHATLADFRRAKGFGRAMAAPQVGILKRIVVMNLGAGPFALLNPEIYAPSAGLFEVWDDCLSIPDRIVRVQRHQSLSLRFLDEAGRHRVWTNLPPDLAELVQHEVDHLDGVLMTDRAYGPDAVQPIARHAELVATGRPRPRLSLDRIARAAATIDPVFRGSPQFDCESLSSALGCRLTLKVETVNPIRSFKGRGADFFLAEKRDERPLVCASAGNWGQALAYAARARGRSLIVYAATNANSLKIERMRLFGAEVRLAGADFDAAKAAAKAAAAAAGAWMVEDGAEPEISEGAGSIAVELLVPRPALDAVLVPVGNGALVTGIGRWMKAASPATRVIGVCAAGADAMQRSFAAGQAVEQPSASTIADGIAVRVPVPEAVADMQGTVDEMRLVSDERILEAMRLIHEHTGLAIEPSGAVGLAAILDSPDDFTGQSLATILCGGNLTRAQLAEWLF
ncbi:MAG: pyridoxal-phosphate dependent enzyme [Bryobacteraceae bacterium]|nr:pyridoxal-phosphate dependent enzyme [Bryobacteraceae bacterium]